MSVYVDDAALVWRGKPRYHLAADTVAELHAFAQMLGIAPCWFHRGAKHPHYDITYEQREAALTAGAQAVSSRDLVRKFRQVAAGLNE